MCVIYIVPYNEDRRYSNILTTLSFKFIYKIILYLEGEDDFNQVIIKSYMNI